MRENWAENRRPAGGPRFLSWAEKVAVQFRVQALFCSASPGGGLCSNPSAVEENPGTGQGDPRQGRSCVW